MMRLPLLLFTCLAIAACGDTGPSKGTVEAAIKRLSEQQTGYGSGGGWLLYPPKACLPDRLRDAKVASVKPCTMIGGPLRMFSCEVTFEMTDGGAATAEFTMLWNEYDGRWAAEVRAPSSAQSVQAPDFYLPC